MKALDWLLKACVIGLNAFATITVVYDHFAVLGWWAYPLAAFAVGLVDLAFIKVWLQFEQTKQSEAQALTNFVQLIIMTAITWAFGAMQGGLIGILLRISTALSMFSTAGPHWVGELQLELESRRLAKRQREAFLASPEGLAEQVKGALVKRSASYVTETLEPVAKMMLTKRVENAFEEWFRPFGADAPMVTELPHGEVKQLGEGEWIASCQWCEWIQMYASQGGARSGLAGHQKAHSKIEVH